MRTDKIKLGIQNMDWEVNFPALLCSLFTSAHKPMDLGKFGEHHFNGQSEKKQGVKNQTVTTAT